MKEKPSQETKKRENIDEEQIAIEYVDVAPFLKQKQRRKKRKERDKSKEPKRKPKRKTRKKKRTRTRER